MNGVTEEILTKKDPFRPGRVIHTIFLRNKWQEVTVEFLGKLTLKITYKNMLFYMLYVINI